MAFFSKAQSLAQSDYSAPWMKTFHTFVHFANTNAQKMSMEAFKVMFITSCTIHTPAGKASFSSRIHRQTTSLVFHAYQSFLSFLSSLFTLSVFFVQFSSSFFLLRKKRVSVSTYYLVIPSKSGRMYAGKLICEKL